MKNVGFKMAMRNAEFWIRIVVNRRRYTKLRSDRCIGRVESDTVQRFGAQHTVIQRSQPRNYADSNLHK